MDGQTRQRGEWSDGRSNIEGKTTKVGASNRGQRTSFNRTRVAGNRDEGEGVVVNTLGLSRHGDVGFIDWLDAAIRTTGGDAAWGETLASE